MSATGAEMLAWLDDLAKNVLPKEEDGSLNAHALMIIECVSIELEYLAMGDSEYGDVCDAESIGRGECLHYQAPSCFPIARAIAKRYRHRFGFDPSWLDD